MINYHPTKAVLEQYVNGDLPATVSVIVASHIELCEQCRKQVALLTEQAANEIFVEDDCSSIEENLTAMFSDLVSNISETSFSLDEEELEMIEAIASIDSEQPLSNPPQTIVEIEVGGKRIALPRAMKSIALSDWKGIGKVSRSRLALEDNNLKASLLHIDTGGEIPAHTHKGFEITLLLEGSFKDEMGEYHVGDFVWLDGEHNHSPVTEEGCICLTVSSDALQFTKGVSQLINPLGKYIY
jgi:putative transcriptional regulator